MISFLKTRWPEYLIEAFGLGIFMVVAGVTVTAIESSASPIKSLLPEPFFRRIPIGLIMGITAIALIYSPWGKRSGAHLNPAVTLTFFRLGKLTPPDAFFYVLAQFIGGVIGVVLVATVLGMLFTEPPVSYIVTVPGERGAAIAFLAESLMAFVLMLTVLLSGNNPRLAKFTGLFAGLLVATYIIVEAPVSGMSINPARTFASGFPSRIWTAFWVYYFAPPLGMLLAAEVYSRYPKRPGVICGKLCPNDETPCLFRRCCCESAIKSKPKIDS